MVLLDGQIKKKVAVCALILAKCLFEEVCAKNKGANLQLGILVKNGLFTNYCFVTGFRTFQFISAFFLGVVIVDIL